MENISEIDEIGVRLHKFRGTGSGFTSSQNSDKMEKSENR